MECTRFEEDLLVAYLFDEATPDERRAIEEHLASCERCSRTLAELKGTVSTLQAWEDEELPRSVVLLPSRKEPERGRLKTPLWLRAIGWAAAAAVLVLVVTQGSVRYGDGSLTVSFGGGESNELTAGLEEGRSTRTPTEVALSTSDSSSSTPQGTGLLPPNQPYAAYASLSDLDRAQKESMSYVAELIKASESRRAEQWRQGIDYLLSTVDEQRRRDLNDLMMRIDAVGAGALGEIQMTNIRLDELASSIGPSGAQDGRQERLTPDQIRRNQKSEDE
jgi:predicted anti-sigma-YlaC factor YlaD